MTCISPLRPSMGARIDDINRESLIREERENDAFPFPRSEKSLTDFSRQIMAPREESGNHAFRFPRSKKPLTDFLRQITTPREKSGNHAFRFPMSKKPLTDFLRGNQR